MLLLFKQSDFRWMRLQNDAGISSIELSAKAIQNHETVDNKWKGKIMQAQHLSRDK